MPRDTPAILGGQPRFAEPLLVTRARAPDPERYARRIAPAFEHRWFTNQGQLVQELEAKLSDRLGVETLAFCNGTIALLAALEAFGLEGEVITTPFTFPATAHAIAWNRLTPVFCDVDPNTYNLDPAAVAAAIGPSTCAILPVHVFGVPCDVEALQRLADHHGLALLYDAAHAFDVVHKGKGIASYGDASMFSFHATKLFHTGEGGGVTAQSADVRARMRLLRNFGIVNANTVDGIGLNGKMSEFHAAVGLELLDETTDEVSARRILDKVYRSALGEVPGIRFQAQPQDTEPNHAYMPIEIIPEQFGLTRNEVHDALLAEGVVPRKYFYPLCSDNVAYDRARSRSGAWPNASRLAGRILCLPIFGELRAEHATEVAVCIERLRRHAPQVRRALGTKER